MDVTAILGEEGIEGVIELPLTDNEQQLDHSADDVKYMISKFY